MLRRFSAFVPFLIAIPVIALAQTNPTTELLEAPYVREFVRVTFEPDRAPKPKTYTLRFGVDNFTDTDDFPKELVLRSDGDVDIFIGNYNPLQQAWTVKGEAIPDVSFKSVTDFFESLKKLQKDLPGGAEQPGGGERSLSTKRGCDKLSELIASVTSKLNPDTPEFDPAEFRRKVDNAVGFDGVQNVAEFLETAKTLIAKNNKDATTELENIRTQFGTEPGHKALQNCEPDSPEDLKAQIEAKQTAIETLDAANAKLAATKTKKNAAKVETEIAKNDTAKKAVEDDIPILEERLAAAEALATQIKSFADLRKKANQIIEQKNKLAESIDKVLDDLAPYRVKGRWRGPDHTDWDIQSVLPDFKNQQKVTVSAKAKDVVLNDDGILVTKDADSTKSSAEFRVRQDSLIVPEGAVAVVYNSLHYPKYGTEKVGDKTVVKRSKKDIDPWNAAVMLNLVMRLHRKSVVYPMLQLGIGTAKDYPSLLAGVGLRFTEPVAFSMSVGGLITRYKDLDDTLKVDQEVTGTAELEKHLVYHTSPVVIYGAIQIKF